jgi:hypothetical protein
MSDHGEDKAVYYAALQRRAGDLSRSLNNPSEIRLPPTLLAAMVRGFLIAAVGYCGAELRTWWLGWLDEKVRTEFGLCQFCGRRKHTFDDAMCETCYKDCVNQDLEMADSEGGVH